MGSDLLLPYKIVEERHLFYTFTTEKDVVYHIYFLDYTICFPGFANIYTFNIEREDDIPHPIDRRIAITVASVLQQFFKENENAVIMICDNLDGKELKRARLFSRWFLQYNDGNIQKYDASSESDDYTLYASLYVHKENRYIKQQVETFYELV